MQFPFSSFSKEERETELIAKDFSQTINSGDVIILNGELGSGKTFFVKKVLENFGISWVNSPTFAIVNEYKNSFKFYHFDFYRVKNEKELFDIGFNDYINDSDAVIFIEWGNLFPSILPRKKTEVVFTIYEDNQRGISINKYV